MEERKNLGGRPKREPDPGERVKLGLRVTAEVKRNLDAAADANGRSQSQEAEFRLEQSFERDRLSEGISQLQATLDAIAEFLVLVSENSALRRRIEELKEQVRHDQTEIYNLKEPSQGALTQSPDTRSSAGPRKRKLFTLRDSKGQVIFKKARISPRKGTQE